MYLISGSRSFPDFEVYIKPINIILFFVILMFSTHVYAMSSPRANVSGNSLTLSWSSVSGASYYQLQYRDGGNPWNFVNAKYYGSSKTWNGITSLNQRSYRMRSCGSSCGAWSGASNVVTIQPLPHTPTLSTPSAAFIRKGFNIGFGLVNNASSYKLYENGALLTTRTSSPIYRVINSSGTYRYQLKACNRSGCSSLSSSRTVSVHKPLPAVPAKPNISVSGQTNSLSWDAVSFAERYEIQIKFNFNNWSTPISVKGTNKSWSGLNPGKRTYRIRACSDKCSEYSVHSESVGQYPKPAVPAKPNISVSGQTNSLLWRAVNYAERYEIQIKFNFNDWSSPISVNGTSKSWSGLNPGKRTYRIRACSDQCSEYSEQSDSVGMYPKPSQPVAKVIKQKINVTWKNVPANTQEVQVYVSYNNGSWVDVSNSKYLTQLNSSDALFENLNAGSRIFKVRACDSSFVCGDFSESSNITNIEEEELQPVYSKSVVYKGGNGDLYVILSTSHGSLAIRIVGDDGDWDVTGITLAALNNLELKDSDYKLEYGNFAGDTREDFKLVLGDGWDDLVFQNNNNNYVYVQYESPDDGTIGNIDANADGIRDDIAEKINKLFPSGNNKGYLEHVSFYTRAFLLDTDKLNKRRHYIEILKGYACLSASAEGEDAYAKIVGGHLDSQERFNRYISNQGFLKEHTLNVKSMDCVLNGTGVEEFSGCFITEPIESNDNFIPGGSGGVHKPTMMPGENVRLEVSAKHVRYDGNFDFSYYLNDVEQGRVRLHKSEEHTFIIDNYLFENDGYLKVKADNKNSDSAYVSFKVSCFEN